MWLEDTDTRPKDGTLSFNLAITNANTLSAPIESEKKASTHEAGSFSTIIPRQIPPPPSDFKGREEDIRDILSNFDKGATITGLRGMAGVGKTVLAFVLADRLKDRFSDGQLFVNLQGTSKNPLSSVEAMAQVIHAYRPTDRLPDHQDEVRGLYLSVLAGKRSLLIFDNAADREQVEPLLPPANCAVLITSRIKFTLPGLKEKDLDVLPKGNACELLIGIAERIGDRAEELAKICGYLPLALRNAASAIAEKKDISVAQYERRLSDKKKLLELVEASFSLSYDLLSPTRRKQWCRLSVFPEDFDISGVAAVWKMGRNPSAEALSDLVKWSLVIFLPSANSEEEGRYRLHDLARIFADSRLDSSQRADAQYRQSKHYLKVLSDADKLYAKGGMSILPGLWLFDKEWVNIKAGQAWAEELIRNHKKLKTGMGQKYAFQLGNSYTTEGILVLPLRLHPLERIRWDENALAAARMIKDRNAEVVHLHNLGNAYLSIGYTRKAIECYESSLSRKRKIEYAKNEGRSLNGLGNAYLNLGKTRKAIGLYEQAQSIAKKVNDKRGEKTSTGNLGIAYFRLGYIRKAIECYTHRLAIDQEIGDRDGEGRVTGDLGDAYFHLGHTRKAIECYRHQLAINQEIGNRVSEALSLNNFGKAYIEFGETRRAIGCLERSSEISHNNRSQMIEGETLCFLGRAYSDLGETHQAIKYYERSLEILRSIEDRNSEGDALCGLGRAYADLGRADKAIEIYNQSLEIVRETEFRRIENDALCNLGKVYIDLDEPSKAIEYCNQALKMACEIEYRKGEGEALFYMSMALDKLGQRKEAIDNAEAALKIFEEIENPLAEKVRSKFAGLREESGRLSN